MTAYPTAQQFGVVHTLVSPNGYTAVFNNPASGDYVGDLLGPEAISGLDSATVKSSVIERAQSAGALQGYNFPGQRPITMRVTINASTTTIRNQRTDKLRKVLNDCMIADGTLTWTPDGSISQFVKVRKNAEYREAGAWVKEGFFGLLAADPFIYSTTQHSQVLSTSGTTIENQGNAAAPPEALTITGPGTGFKLMFLSYPAGSQDFYLDGLTLAGGQSATVNWLNRTILRNDGTNLYEELALPPNGNWNFLNPGNNSMDISIDSGSTGATVFTLYWRDAWL